MLEFKEDNHEYKWDGVVVPSVSQKINKVLNNNEDIPEYAKKYAEIGTNAHKIIQLDLTLGVDLSSIDEKLKGFILSYLLLKEECKFEPEQVEYRLYNKEENTAMTLDYLGKVKGARSLLDWKTGGIYKKYRPQMGGYLNGLHKSVGIVPDYVYLAQLFKTGKKGILIKLDFDEIYSDWYSVNRIYNIMTERGL